LAALRDAYPSALTHSQIAISLGLRTDACTLHAISTARYELQRAGHVDEAFPEQRSDGRTGRPQIRVRYVPQTVEVES
jgi:hypothetical protein